MRKKMIPHRHRDLASTLEQIGWRRCEADELADHVARGGELTDYASLRLGLR